MGRRVLYFTDSPGFGGAEKVLLTLMGGLDRQQWRLSLAHHAEAGITPLIQVASAMGVSTHSLPTYASSGRLWRTTNALALLRLLRSSPPDVFHANLTWPLAARYALLVAALAGVPLVIATIHSFDVAIARRSALLHRLIAAGVHRYIAVSQFVAGRMTSMLGVPAHKVAVVRNGICLNPVDAPAEAPVPCVSAPPVVLTPARLDPVKGHAVLLAAAAKVPNAIFQLAGDGPLRDSLASDAGRLGIADRVEFLGHRSDIADLLARCDLVVLPSLCEGFGLAVVEAMVAGKPVIATNAGALPEVVQDGETGLLVPPADPNALADAIRKLLADPRLASRLAIAGRIRARREFGAQRVSDAVAREYTDGLRGQVA